MAGANQEPSFDKFYGYLSELLRSYTKLYELLIRKLAAIAAYDIAALDSIIKEEQVFVLLARGFDTNMQNFRNKLSLTGDSLSAVIPQMPEHEQQRFTSLFHTLRAKLDDVKSINEKCQSLIEERIYSLERAIRSIDKSAGTPYGGKAATGPAKIADPHILHRQI